ncbi:MAG: aldehyde dehydrogenase family protein [Marmoricola sp.]
MALPSTITDELLDRLTSRVSGSTDNTWKLTEVYTGEVITELPQSKPADIEAAFDKARAAQHEWSQWPLEEAFGGLQAAFTRWCLTMP